jgi:hypothetical protein
MTELKNWGQLIGYFVGGLVALFGLGRAFYDIAANRKQRADELRWRQAQASRELLDDIHNHELAKQAVHMLDWVGSSAEYKISENQVANINFQEVCNALALHGNDPCGESQAYIRDCFDWFFYRIEQIEHYIRRGLIQFEDVQHVFRVYAREIAKHKEVFDGFLKFHEYDLARDFFARYSKK